MSNNGEKLTTLQNNFALAYTAFGMSTYANGLLSIIAAGSKAKTNNALMATASQILSYPKVKAKIDAIEATRTAHLAEKTGYTIEQAQTEYEEARVLAMKVNQPAAAASATTGKARLYGFDKDNAIGEKTVIIISPKIAQEGPQQAGTKAIESKEVG